MNRHVFIIAEAGVNHNGSVELAKKLIDAAVQAGVDAVKFQTFSADSLVSGDAPKAEYQRVASGLQESQYKMLKKLEMDEAMHNTLMHYSTYSGIEFLSTPFDENSLDLLSNRLGLNRIKIPSGEITNAPFLLKIARTGKQVILSTGMSTLGEVETALGVLAFGYLGGKSKPSPHAFARAFASTGGHRKLQQKVTLLHCTTEYPAPFEDVNLQAMDTLRKAFGLPVGYSDHTDGIAVAIAAVARGAVLVEKHLTLDKRLPGPDHKASLEPDELTVLVRSIRQVEQALGTGLKVPATTEIKNRLVARKSLVATQDIGRGEPFSESNLSVKRPGDGLPPLRYWDMLGRKATKNYCKDERILE
ncbi:N-acetylneuraminate synthase [Anaeroselena agilis]|uniref:N-acetylneuraminate synthase n=1 Tax=Anaeroselena agilis TaxID=3063788 RepID=A0ABU3P486_9FIRM|nr:N-acetylneuraminate synthase [Selenomonadales bacterium 4137-cl]